MPKNKRKRLSWIEKNTDRISLAWPLGLVPKPLRVYYRKEEKNAEGLPNGIEESGKGQLEKMIEEFMQLEEFMHSNH